MSTEGSFLDSARELSKIFNSVDEEDLVIALANNPELHSAIDGSIKELIRHMKAARKLIPKRDASPSRKKKAAPSYEVAFKMVINGQTFECNPILAAEPSVANVKAEMRRQFDIELDRRIVAADSPSRVDLKREFLNPVQVRKIASGEDPIEMELEWTDSQ